MSMSNSELINKYKKYMTNSKDRMYAMESIFNGFTTTEYRETNIEFLANQLRAILESICYASLICNEKKYKAVHKNAEKHTRAKEIIIQLQSIHPSFFPVPQDIKKATGDIDRKLEKSREAPVSVIATRSKSTNPLTIDDFSIAYDLTSDIIHVKNPFQERETNYKNAWMEFNDYLHKCHDLLDNHITFLSDNRAVICQLNSKNQLVTAGLLEKTSDYVPE